VEKPIKNILERELEILWASWSKVAFRNNSELTNFTANSQSKMWQPTGVSLLYFRLTLVSYPRIF